MINKRWIREQEQQATKYPHILGMAGVNQPIHWFVGGKGLGIQQGTNVWVGPLGINYENSL